MEAANNSIARDRARVAMIIAVLERQMMSKRAPGSFQMTSGGLIPGSCPVQDPMLQEILSQIPCGSKEFGGKKMPTA